VLLPWSARHVSLNLFFADLLSLVPSSSCLLPFFSSTLFLSNDRVRLLAAIEYLFFRISHLSANHIPQLLGD
jgi:hypothetical protein